MTLKDQLNDAMKAAMKARDDLRLSTVRLVRATVKNSEIDQKRELDDQGVIEVISMLAKQRRESIRLYREGDRLDLATKEEAELAILLSFLPPQLTETEISDLIIKAISETEAHSSKDLGRVMRALTPLIAGRADGKTVHAMVTRLLS